MRRHLAYAAAGAVALALAGCGGDEPTPKVADPTTAPSASPSASEGAAAKQEWKEKTPEGAMAFAEHWVAQFSESFVSGDTESLTQLSAASCTTCQAFIDLIDDVYDDGGSIQGEPWALARPAWSAPDGPDGPVAVRATMRIPEQIIDRSGKAPSTAEATREAYVFVMDWQQGKWTVQKLLRDSA